MKKFKVPLSDEQYLKKAATCPFCGSDNISGEEISIEGNEAWQEVSCNDCESSWQDIYELVGYSGADGKEPKGKPATDKGKGLLTNNLHKSALC